MARTLTETEIAAAARMLKTAKPRSLRSQIEMHFGDVDDASADAVQTRIAELAAAPAPAPVVAPVVAPEPAPIAAPAPAPRTMTARYDSRCVACGGSIRAGATIVYSKAAGAAHATCSASTEPRVVAYRERRDRTEGGLFESDYE